MSFTDAQVLEWFRLNPNATDEQIAQAMQQAGVGTLQVARVTGASNDDVTRRYNVATGQPEWTNRTPTAPATQPPAQQPWETLTSSSNANDVSNAYSSFLKSIGSQDTDATRVAARDYLTNLGMGAPAIDQAYAHFKDNQPQFNTQENSIGDVANNINKAGQTLQDPTKYTPNPFLPQMADAMTNQVTQNLNRNIMPGIRSAATATGGYGGSRQGVVESNAINDANQGLSNALAGMYMGDYNSQMGRNLQQYGMDQGYNLGLGNLGLGFQNSGQNFDLGMGQLGLGFQNSNQNFFTQQRGQDLQQTGLGASIYQMGTQGMLGQGQGMYNLGLTAQQAPWQTLQGFTSTSQPYTGYGSTTQNQSGSSAAGFAGGAMLGNQLYQIWK
jgi:hypothetical protein